MGGVALNAKVVDQLSILLGLRLGPLKVWTVEFHALVPHLGDGSDCALQILRQFIAHRVKFKPHWNRLRNCKGLERKRHHGRHREKRPPGGRHGGNPNSRWPELHGKVFNWWLAYFA